MSKAQLLFLAVLASIPVQLGKYFFPSYSYVLGIPIDYLAQTIYLSDIFLIIFVLFSLIELKSKKNARAFFRNFVSPNRFYLLSLSAFVLFSFLDTALFSASKETSLYFNLKILEFALFSIFAGWQFSQKKNQKKIAWILAFSIIWQFFLVCLEFLSQRSIGLWILGEREMTSVTPQIAHFDLFGFQLLRPYGTFPHPNVLGSFLVVYLIILFSISKNKKFPAVAAAAACFLSFSKGALFTLFAAFIIISKNFRQFALRAAVLIVLTFAFLRLVATTQLASLAERLLLIKASLDLSLKNPLFGVGSGNFIYMLSKLDITSISQVRLLQPVHNIFLLVAVENGFFGLILFSLLLFSVARKSGSQAKMALFTSILVFLTIDHYLWTLQQGLLLLWLSLAFIIASPNEASS